MNGKRYHVMVTGLTEEQAKAIKIMAIGEGKSVSQIVKEFLLNKIKED